MNLNLWPARALSLVVLCAAALGCDDRSSTRTARRTDSPAQPQALPSTRPSDAAQVASASQPATRGAQTKPAAAFLTIDGRIVEFPPARLRLTKTDEGVRALLFTDDPKNAASADYHGNSFYFDVPLRVADPADVADAEYAYKAPTSDTDEDSPNGIFLDGMRTHLQPQDIVLAFDGDSPRLVARLAGRFLVVHTTARSTPNPFAAVNGSLFITAEVKAD